MEIERKTSATFSLTSRRRLSGGDKEVFEITLTADGPISYEPGDWLAMTPVNCGEEVRRLLRQLDASGHEFVQVRGGEVALVEALSSQLSIGEVPPKLAELLISNGAEKNREILKNALHGDFKAFASGLSVCDFLEKFGGRAVPLNAIVSALSPLRPRLYSIASCPFAMANALRLVVTTATYVDRGDKTRSGVASSYLNGRLALGDSLSANIVHTKFRLPADPNGDVIMVGPGAGLAPFIGFLERREWERKTKNSSGRNWLFFGDRHRATDFLFEDRLTKWMREGLLTRLDLAFSRDQERKVYVQDRIRENGEEVNRWIGNGAKFYICGDGKRMAVDVEAALAAVFVNCGEMDESAAVKMVTAMKRDGRLQRDVY